MNSISTHSRKFESRCFRSFVLIGCILISTPFFCQLDTTIVKTYGGAYFEDGNQIIQCSNGGYIMLGTSGSDVSNNTSFYVVRVDEELNCIWNAVLGGPGVDRGQSLAEDMEGNFYLCGYTNSYGEGGYDILVYKLDQSGNVLWQKTYGGSDWDFASKIILNPQGGFLMCGETYSQGNGGSDCYLLQIDNDGILQNEWTYGGLDEDRFTDVEAVSDGFVLCGSITINGLRNSSVWRMNNLGETIWVKVKSDNIHEFEATSIEASGEYLYLTGNRKFGSLNYGFIQRMNLFGEEVGFLSEEESSSYYFYDSQVINEDWNIIGRTRVVGYGGYDGILWRRTVDGGFVGGFFYGTGADDKFSSIVLKDDAMILSGARQVADGSWQALGLYYSKTVLESENNMNPIEQDCFTVDIAEWDAKLPLQFEMVDVFNVSGHLLYSNVKFDQVKLESSLPTGLYFLKSIQDHSVKRIFVR